MDDLAGVLVLLGLVVLAVPILLIVALVSISGLKRRVGDLEGEVYRLQASEPAPAAARPAYERAPAASVADDVPSDEGWLANRPWPN